MNYEKAILGWMILDNSLDSTLLETRLFSSEKNRLVFDKIRELKGTGEVVDVVTLNVTLQGEVEVNYLSGLLDGIPKIGRANFNYYVNKLIQANKEQELKKLASETITEPEFIPKLKKILASYELEETEPIESLTVAAHTEKLKEFIEKKREGEFWGFNITCFPNLTRALMGLREIAVLAAEEKIGKSTLVLQIATDIAGQGYPVIYYDFENGRENLMARILCQRFNIKYREELFSRGDELSVAIKGGLNSLEDQFKSLAIITDRKLSIDKIRGHVFQMKQQTKQEKSLVVIDSLQKLPMKDLKDRRAAVDRWLRDIEGLRAEDPHLTFLIVSEVSREKKQPKESGDIEYTAHFLLRLKRNQEKERDDDLEPSDDMRRRLFLERARDVESNKLVSLYEVDFDYWKFEELSDNW